MESIPTNQDQIYQNNLRQYNQIIRVNIKAIIYEIHLIEIKHLKF